MDGARLIEDAGSTRRKHRPGFYDRPIMGISIAIGFLGVLCLGLGTAALVVSLTSVCEYEVYVDDYGYQRTRTDSCRYLWTNISPGIWSGLMYLASGIIGILAAKRKTTCFIVSMMILSLLTTCFAVGAMTLSIGANFIGNWEQVNPYPLFLYITDSWIAFFGLVAFILSWIKFGYACRAVCCNGKKLCPASKPCFQYQHPSFQPITYASSSNHFTQGIAPMTQPTTQQAYAAAPVYLVQGNQVIGILPTNAPQMQGLLGTQTNAGTPQA